MFQLVIVDFSKSSILFCSPNHLSIAIPPPITIPSIRLAFHLAANRLRRSPTVKHLRAHARHAIWNRDARKTRAAEERQVVN